MMQMQKDAYHKKPTYAEIVKQTITNPTDKIALPDRQATQLRNTPQLTRYDDESFTDLNADNQSIILEQLKQITLRQAVSTHTIHTHGGASHERRRLNATGSATTATTSSGSL
jgi:hypothetical protein